MIDASKGFMKDGPKNRLRSQDIHKIVDVFNKQTEIERYSRMVPLAEIADPKNDYNLNIPRYIDSSEPEDIQDLDAHLHGGIPDRDIDAARHATGTPSPACARSCSSPTDPATSTWPSTSARCSRPSSTHPSSRSSPTESLTSPPNGSTPTVRRSPASIADTRPNDLIATIGDDLLARFKPVPLLDEYDVYEQLMSYWHSTMHDDVFLIMNEGWVEAAKPRAARILGYDKNKKPKFEDADIQLGTGAKAQRYVMDLIPPGLVVARYLSDDQVSVEN